MMPVVVFMLLIRLFQLTDSTESPEKETRVKKGRKPAKEKPKEKPKGKERQQNLESAPEMRLIRTILERLEYSFAKQEAKLDQLLQALSSRSFPLQPQQSPKPQQVSTPNVGVRQSSVEYPFMASAYSRPPLSDPGVSSVFPVTPLFPEVDRLMEDVYQVDRQMPEMGTVPVLVVMSD